MERGQLDLTVTLHLVRHAAHALLGRVLTGRQPGVVLSSEGRAQAERLAETLASHPITAIVSSPRERAVETARPLARRLGLELTVDEGLDEIDFGAWSGQMFQALAADPLWAQWNRARGLSRCPGGETMAEAQARALAAVLRHADRPEPAQLVLVGHQDVLKSVLLAMLGTPIDFIHRLAWDPAHRATIQLEAGIPFVQAFNAAP